MKSWKAVFGGLVSALAFSVAASADGDPQKWVKALPADWAPFAAKLCRVPKRASSLEGIYVSEYVGNRKIFAIDAAGRYRFAKYVDQRRTFAAPPDVRLAARDVGTVEVDGELITLLPDKPSIRTSDGHPASEWHEYRLVALDYAGSRLLLDEDHLDDIGASVQWSRHLGRSDYFYRRMECDEIPVDSAGTDGAAAPPWSAMPTRLKAWTFESPIHATITEILRDAPNMGEGEVLVRIDKGKADRFRINMPLCSNTPDHIHGWVLDVNEHSSTFRVEVPDPKHTDVTKFVRPGMLLSTSAEACPRAR